MPMGSVEEILGILFYNLPDKYHYNKDSTVYVFDSERQENWSCSLNEKQIQELNNTAAISQGTVMWSWFGNGKKSSETDQIQVIDDEVIEVVASGKPNEVVVEVLTTILLKLDNLVLSVELQRKRKKLIDKIEKICKDLTKSS